MRGAWSAARLTNHALIMRELLLKEVELLSGIVDRLSNHGQTTKQFAVTTWMAATGYALKEGLPMLHLVGVVGALVFWQLDAFFLAKERRFVRRHHQLATLLAQNPDHPKLTDPMSLTANLPRGSWYTGGRHLWAFLGRTLWPLYGSLAAISAWCWIMLPRTADLPR